MHEPLPFHPGVENRHQDEEKTERGLLRTISKITAMSQHVRKKANRGVHAKSIALLNGELSIAKSLPPELAQGLFAHPGTYKTTIRISVIPGDILPDSVSTPRGFAIKIADVPGPLLPDANGEASQDFLFASGRAFSAPTPKAFLRSLWLLSQTTERLTWLKVLMSKALRPLQNLATRLGYPINTLNLLGGYRPLHPLGESFFTQAALRYGEYVAKLGIFPESQSFKALENQAVPIDHGFDALREAVTDTLRQAGGSWTLRAQLRRNEETDSIEDASKIWPEEDNPYVVVATLTIQAQEGWSDALSREIDDGLAFSPWQGLEAHQPLGAVMRARRYVYPKAAALRRASESKPSRSSIVSSETSSTAVKTTSSPRRKGTVTTSAAKKSPNHQISTGEAKKPSRASKTKTAKSEVKTLAPTSRTGRASPSSAKKVQPKAKKSSSAVKASKPARGKKE